MWQSGVRSCIMPEVPTHLVQESNAGTGRNEDYERAYQPLSKNGIV